MRILMMFNVSLLVFVSDIDVIVTKIEGCVLFPVVKYFILLLRSQ
jgi:hypothetical protein